MEMIIGRKGQQKIAITDVTVSREHCKLTSNADGTYTLENLSANGTFVEGKSIVRTVVTPDTIIQLGNSYTVRISDLIGKEEMPKPALPKNNNVEDGHRCKAQFQHLKAVYDKYYETKIAMQREANLKNFYRSLPTAITTILFALSMFVGDSSFLVQARPFIGIAMMLFIGITTVSVYNGQKEMPEKMEALNKQFMIDYVCPKCGNFLGFIPFEVLVNKKMCGYCKCQWV